MASSDSESDEEFGPKLPPLSVAIKGILQRYPDGQIFKEVIQNADDAGAKEVHFYVDHRQHPKENLVHNRLAEYQGPALISYNDAVFEKKDWKGIQSLQQSVKADDPFKVGQFGIGFNSVYHVTDLPMIVSGNKVGFLDPRKKIWSGKCGYSRKLNTVRQDHPNHLVPLDGIAGFSLCNIHDSGYQHTLFRFPLRSKESDLSKNLYDPMRVLKLINALREEAKLLLLFLRSVERVEVYEINSRGNHILQFMVEISGENQSALQLSLREERASFCKKIRDSYSQQQSHNVYNSVVMASVKVTDNIGSSSSVSRWLIASYVEAENVDVLKDVSKMATEQNQSVLPWVGTALELSVRDDEPGRIFCFLPMPRETFSDLPVHVNGTFSLSDNRRTLKWPVRERMNDLSANWNKTLVEKVFPPCYILLLRTALEFLTAEEFYSALPNVNKISKTNWKGLLNPLYTDLFKYACLWSLNESWVKVNSATFIPEHEDMDESVKEVLTSCGYNLVAIPSNVWSALCEVNIRTATTSPEIARHAIRANKGAYIHIHISDKLDLLKYCLSDEEYSQIVGLQLLPLANGKFETFQASHYRGECSYICTDDCPLELLPGAEHRLVNLSDQPSLHAQLEMVAHSKQTQLKILDARAVATLIPLTCSLQYVDKFNFLKNWFPIFWNWVRSRDYDLKLFKNLLIIPIASEANKLSVVKLKPDSGVVLVRSIDNHFPLSILTKLGIKYTLCKYVPYLKHSNLMEYLNPLTADGVMTAIEEVHTRISEIRDVSFSKKEAEAFQILLARHQDLSSHQETINSLKVFFPLDEIMPVSLHESSLWGKRVVVEPRSFCISSCNIPSDLVVLSLSSNNLTVLKTLGDIVHFPKLSARLILDYIFPLICTNNFEPLSSLIPLMEEIFDVFSKLRSSEFITKLKTLPFLCHSSECAYGTPRDLFDPSKEDLKQLYYRKEVFPLSPFDEEEYLIHLRTCGLKTTVSAQDLYDILSEISQHNSLEKVDEDNLIRARAVFKYIQSHTDLLCQYISVEWNSESLHDAIIELAREKSILPIEPSPHSEDYPSCLEWRGSEFISHLTTMNSSVLPCSSKDISTLPNIVGSQLYVVHCSPELCSALIAEPPVKHVVAHFMEVIKYKDKLKRVALERIVNETYNYFRANLSYLLFESSVDLRTSNWIWLKRLGIFVKPDNVALEYHPNFTHNLSPFVHVLTEDYSMFSDLFTSFGAHAKITNECLVSVLHSIRREKHSISSDQAWKMVYNILNYFTDHGKKDITGLDDIYVPIESKSSYPELAEVGDVVYTNLKYLKKFRKRQDSSLKFIHKDYEWLTPCLGLTPLGEKFNIIDVGQSESLVKRLKNILRDYNDGLTIVKELLQNADDAGASEVNICYDARQHSQDEDDLIFKEMAKSHGPALIIQNNKTFSDEDFKNIQQLAGATKKDQPLKIGKFGVGFCSVYHITDVPSFLSRDLFYIFDPTLTHLKDDIGDHHKPGKSFCFTDEFVQCSSQMDPYKNIFNFHANVPYDGTMFRLPFRTHSSDISTIKYDDEQVESLLSDVKEAGPKLLLFMNNLKKITFSRMDDSMTSHNCLLTVTKSIVKELDNTNAKIVRLSVHFKSGIMFTTDEHLFLVAENKDFVNGKFSAVACSLEELSSSHTFTYLPREVQGEVFCFLPLHLEIGLPVHVNANFAVMNDRRGIHHSDAISKSDESKFNVQLMEKSIPLSYHKLLITLRDLCIEKKISEDSFKFFTFWPLQESLKSHNPWDYFLSHIYKKISSGDLCYSKCVKQWNSIECSKILSANILQPEHAAQIVSVMETLMYPLVSLPEKYHSHLRDEVVRSTVNENEFVDIFFRNIEKFSTSFEMRNNILLSIITTYAIRPSATLKSHITNNPCIPCTPDGRVLKGNEVLDNRVQVIRDLYEPEEGMFPVKSFNTDIVHVTLLGLRVITSQLPWQMIIERAKTVKKLYASDRLEALKRSSLLMNCIETNLKQSVPYSSSLPPEANELTTIDFLPILQKSKGYPKELLWAGSGKDMLSCSQVLRDQSSSLSWLVGSTVPIISQELPINGGCGPIPHSVASGLGVGTTPSTDAVMKHLQHIASTYDTLGSFTSWISKACDRIYKHFEEERTKKTSLKRLHSQPGLLWNGSEFLHHEQIALNWKHDGPYLFAVPSPLKLTEKLKSYLEFQEDFSTDLILQVLNNMKDTEKLNQKEEKIIPDIAKALRKSIGEVEMLNTEQMELCYLPDDKLCMRNVKDLAVDDAYWCRSQQDNYYFIHHSISYPVAVALGVKTVRSRTLDMYSSPNDHFAGVPFGQQEDLTQRIRNILENYTLDETVLKELLQNADDAKATKLYFILDERTHETRKLPKDEWKDLQGPALLIWNDKGFTEDDMEGIQKLGLGSKRSKAESIGQYGIGFNVVYHLTDCPSFFTNGHTLCVLDPHCRYIPGANERKPGRRLDNVNENFWSTMSDLKTPYLREGLTDCPNEIRDGGTLFRFPLRSTAELIKKSKLIEDKTMLPLFSWRMKEQLEKWAPVMKKALLFLKHVTELKFFVIKETKSESAVMISTHHYKCGLNKHGHEQRSKLHDRSADFTEYRVEKPFLVNYELKLIEEVPKREEEIWLVQQGVGDINNPLQHWEFLSHIKPMHGLAAQIEGSSFTPYIFCFLPLPDESMLPVHVNGNFMLDSSRRNLWKSNDTSTPDDKKKWNNRLIEALGSSYAQFLKGCQCSIIEKEGYTKKRDLSNDLERYYRLFPKWIDAQNGPVSEMKDLAQTTYKRLANKDYKVLITVNKSKISDTSFQQSTHKKIEYLIDWHPVANDDKSKQIYFWKTSEELNFIPSILKQIGIVLSAAPIWIKEHFDSVGSIIPQALPNTVYEYFTQHCQIINPTQSYPVHISNTCFNNVESMKNFIQYLVETTVSVSEEETYSCSVFPSPPFGFPLLLTADKCVRLFDENEMVIASEFSPIFKNVPERFLHLEMLKLKLDRRYFIQPSQENWGLVQKILSRTLKKSLLVNRVKDSHLHIDTESLLPLLWKCIRQDKVFQVHSKEIVKKWALILSNDDELFRYDPDQSFLMPLTPPHKPRTSSEQFSEDALISEVYEILKKHGMPVVHRIVLKAKEYCPNFSTPTGILTNLCHFNDEREELHSLLAAKNVDAQVRKLFSYFGRIHFSHDQVSLSNIKRLPMFKNIDGRYCNLLNEVYFWPNLSCMAGIKELLSETSVVFLKHDDPWTELTIDAAILGIKSVHDLEFYVNFIFPQFHLLNDNDRISHLNFINTELYSKADGYSKMDADKKLQTIGNIFISELKKLPMLKNKDGQLEPAFKFYDPFIPVFKVFPDKYEFPPKELHSSEWLSFLIKIGLQTRPSQEEFTQFCVQVSKGNHADIIAACKVLLELLFKTYDWHEDENFLCDLSKIPFIQTKPPTDLEWILPPSQADVSIIRHKKKHTCLISPRNCASDNCAPLIWTVRPVVKFPWITHPPNVIKFSKRTEREQLFMKNLGICVEPSTPQVIENICNLSASRFSNIRLFENYNLDCVKPKPKKDTGRDSKKDTFESLAVVIEKNLKYLSDSDNLSDALVSKLSVVPFIPVSKDCRGDLSCPVLVHPLQVVTSMPPELEISLHPCLIALPKELHPYLGTLMRAGVNHAIKLKRIFHAFKLIHSHFRMPLDPNTVKSVQSLLKVLYQHLNSSSLGDIDLYEGDHYLPNHKHHLSKCSNLLYDDRGWYKNERFDFKSAPNYSFMSLMCYKNDEIEQYEFRMRDLIEKIPQSIRPIALSTCCTNRIDTRCKPSSELTSFAKMIESSFQISSFSEAAEHLMKKENDNGACNRFSSALKKFVGSIKVFSVPDLKVDLYLDLTDPPSMIGSAHMDLLICRDDNDQFTLHIDSSANAFSLTVLELLTTSILTEVLKMSGVDAKELKDPYTAINQLLKAKSPDDIKMILNHYGIKTSGMRFERKFDYHLNPKLGEPIPEEWHHRLYSDINNNFKPQELVGYEKQENCIIFARVEYKIREDDEDEVELDRYAIRLNEKEEEGVEVIVLVVSVIDLHKILRIKEDPGNDSGRDLVLFDPDSNIVRWWDSIKEEKLMDILLMIYQELQRIIRIQDDDIKRKALKAMFLKWHPDKNENPLATKAFQYLERQIRRIKEGLEIENPDECWKSEPEIYHSDWFHAWMDIARQRQRYHDNEHNWRSRHGGADSDNSKITVSPDQKKSKVWMKQAECDVHAMKENYRLVRNSDVTLCALVCFLSHQVAEKILKAGMFTKNGLHPDALHHHSLIAHANALEQVDATMIGLSEQARILEGKDYYLKSRYPNRYSPHHQVPSECLSFTEAEEAVDISMKIYNMVCASVQFS